MAQKIFNEESKEYKNKKRRILKPRFFSINVIKIIPMMSAKKMLRRRIHIWQLVLSVNIKITEKFEIIACCLQSFLFVCISMYYFHKKIK